MVWNKRQYARCPLPQEKSAGVLVIGSRSIPCQVQEVSLSGFGVLVPSQLPEGDKLGQLKVGELTYVVRVTRQEVKRAGVLVALEQVEEIVPDSSMLPATRLGQWMTRLAWIAAIAVVATAIYCVTDVHETAMSALHL
jgi:hypothetical protein